MYLVADQRSVTNGIYHRCFLHFQSWRRTFANSYCFSDRLSNRCWKFHISIVHTRADALADTNAFETPLLSVPQVCGVPCVPSAIIRNRPYPRSTAWLSVTSSCVKSVEFADFPCDVIPTLLPDSTRDVIPFQIMVPDTTRDARPSASRDSACDVAAKVHTPALTNRRCVANLQHPRIQRHTVGQELQARVLLKIRPMAKKRDDVRELFHTHHLDVLSLNETWHDDADCAAIKRLLTLGVNVTEAASPISSKAKRDTVSYANHGGVEIVSRSRGVTIANISVMLKVSMNEWIEWIL